MQFYESKSGRGACPICGTEVVIRDVKIGPEACSKRCASMKRYEKRYRGTMSGPLDRPDMKDKTKL